MNCLPGMQTCLLMSLSENFMKNSVPDELMQSIPWRSKLIKHLVTFGGGLIVAQEQQTRKITKITKLAKHSL